MTGNPGLEPKLRIHLLGGFSVARDGETLPEKAWNRRRARDLLLLLASSPGRRASRDQVIGALWPDKDPASGANNLHRAVHDLRTVVGPDFVSVEKGLLLLGDGVWVDVDEFERLSAAGEPEAVFAALDIYRGDLWSPPTGFEGGEARRQELRQKFVGAALTAAQQIAYSDRRRAVEVLRKVLSIDAANEEAHRLLIRTLAQGGRRAEALRQFEDCARVLREELGADVSDQTRQLHEAVVHGEIGPARPVATGWTRVARRLLGSADPPVTRGRSDVLAVIDDFARSPSGVLLLIGEAGIGKTHAAVEAARRAADNGATLMCGAALEFVQSAPYAPFVDAWTDHLRSSGSDLQENPFLHFRSAPGANPQEEKLKLFHHVEQSLESLGGGRTVYLAIDDLHFADESTLHLFHYLARAARTLPLLLVGTCREEELAVNPALHSLVTSVYRERLAHRISLNRLDRQSTRSVILDRGGEETAEEHVQAIYNLTGGNPFFVEEVVQSLRDRGTGAPVLSADLATVIVERVQRLGGEVEQVLIAAAAIGQTFDFELARNVAGIATGVKTLEIALAAKLVEEDEHTCRFRHALVREALYQNISRARRKELHRSIANAIEAGDEDRVEALAFHFHAAGEPRRALPYQIESARRAAARLGFGEAVQRYEQALASMDELQLPPDAQRFQILLRLGQMNFSLSNLDVAVDQLDAAASLMRESDGWRPAPTHRAKARRCSALALITAGALEEANRRLEYAMADLREEPDSPELPNVLYHLAQLRWHEGRHDDAYAVAEQCLREAERRNDSNAIAKGYEILSLSCHSLGEWKTGMEFEERRRALVGSTVDVAQAFDVHL